MENLPYQSQAWQDRFAAKILNYKRDGFYLDVGGCHAISTNNSYALESLGWRGIVIEMNPEHTESYKQRTCKHVEADATKIDYTKLLEENNAPKVIDYLSLDIDAASTTVLKILPLDKYVFSVVTIEHDYYIHHGIYRDEQREILKGSGYLLLCPDVCAPLDGGTKEFSKFEDWWIGPSILEPPMRMRPGMYPHEILEALG